jgi:hypothetical protein
MCKLLVTVLAAAATVSGFTFSSPANAAALYFDKVFVKTSSERTCFRFAADTARIENFRNVHKNALEVAGEKDGAYVSITCVGRNNQPAVAIVMSVADTLAGAKHSADLAANRIKGIVCFDSPC